MSAYGREWEKCRNRIEATRQHAEKVTGKTFPTYAHFHEHVSMLRTILEDWSRREHDIGNIKETDR